jgi:hypothetical protein
MARESRRLEESLSGLLEAAGPEGTPLLVSFPEPLPPYTQALLKALGVRLRVDPEAPRLSTIKSSGRSSKTRRNLDPLVRQRQREAYYARPDKRKYAPPQSRPDTQES